MCVSSVSGLLVFGIVVSQGLAHRPSLNLHAISMEACTDTKLSTGDQVDQYIVEECLGKGVSAEVWTLRDSGHVLKYYYGSPAREECLFGQVAAQKDSIHFVNCFDISTKPGSGYTVWEKVEGKELYPLLGSPQPQEFTDAFPNLYSALNHLTKLFHAFDALQQPGTTGVGSGVRQWHHDSHLGNVMVSPSSFKLIDYGISWRCCADGFSCADVPPGMQAWMGVGERAVKLGSSRDEEKALQHVVQNVYFASDGKSVSEIRDPTQILQNALDAMGPALSVDLSASLLTHWAQITEELHGPCSALEDSWRPEEQNFKHGTNPLITFFVSVALPLPHSAYLMQQILRDRPLQRIVQDFNEGLRPMYQDDWNAQCETMLRAMVEEVRGSDRSWPPRFMEEVRTALASL